MNAAVMNEEQKKIIGALFEKHADHIFAYILGILGDAAEASDIVSETFVRAFAEPRLAAADFNCRAWLFTVATNLARNHIGRYLKRFLSFSGSNLDLRSSKIPGVEETVRRNEDFIKLSKALRTIDQTDREIIFLKYFEEMSYAEIAKITGLSESAVGSRLSRAIGRLSNELE